MTDVTPETELAEWKARVERRSDRPDLLDGVVWPTAVARSAMWAGVTDSRSVAGSAASVYGADVDDRFFSKVDKTVSGCWLWTGSLSGGYPRFALTHSRQMYAHVFAHQRFIGSVPDGMDVDHLCHDPTVCTLGTACPHRRCVNPDHLEATTRRENLLRSGSFIAKNAAKTHCPHGHPYSGTNLYMHPTNGQRMCLTCKRAAGLAHYYRSKVTASA